MADLRVNLSKLKLKNPIITASGTFGYGDELSGLIDLKSIGAIVTKTITLNPKAGNPPPRICEVENGMINAIGLQNVGLRAFIEEKLPALKKVKTDIIVSIAGRTSGEYIDIVRALNPYKEIKAIELNLSCPNLKKKIICQDTSLLKKIIGGCSKISKKPLIAKLSPLLSDIAYTAKVSKDSGADILALVNTFPAMAIDIVSFKPKVSTITGGISGPVIKPLALRCVWEVSKNVDIPIIGIGGISNSHDAIEFILAGASAVQVGTANFIDSQAPVKIVKGIEEMLRARRIKTLKELTGALRV